MLAIILQLLCSHVAQAVPANTMTGGADAFSKLRDAALVAIPETPQEHKSNTPFGKLIGVIAHHAAPSAVSHATAFQVQSEHRQPSKRLWLLHRSLLL